MKFLVWILVVTLSVVCVSQVYAQTGRMIYEDYASAVDRQSAVVPIGTDDGFGERTDINSGSTSFFLTPVSMPGNNSLEVAVRLRYEPVSYGSGTGWDWIYDIPRLVGTYSKETGWLVGTLTTSTSRCSYPSTDASAPEVSNTDGKVGSFAPDEYWKGVRLSLPGGGGGLLNLVVASAATLPAVGGPYKWVTNDHWYFSCIPLVNGPGEGFLARAPDGTKYYFDRLERGRTVDALKKYNYLGLTVLQRREYQIIPSKIEDRFGNTVVYTYDAATPIDILASDGRHLTFARTAGSMDEMSGTISDGTRTWTMSSGTSSSGTSFAVTNPDGSVWSLSRTGGFTETMNLGTSCTEGQRQRLSGSAKITVSLPSGAVADFDFSPRQRGFSYMPYDCATPDEMPGSYNYVYVRSPNVVSEAALVRKTVRGPGISTYWSELDYGPLNNCYATSTAPGACTTSSPTSRTTTITSSDGRYRRYVFGNRAFVNQGQLLSVAEGTGASPPMRTTVKAWTPFAEVGAVNAGGMDFSYSYADLKRFVQISNVITQEGTTFLWQVASDCGGAGDSLCFDSFARPTKVTQKAYPTP